MVERHGDKRWYLKVDADAILRPQNLLQLLAFLEREATPPTATPIYFGNHWGAYNCTGALQSRFCRNVNFLTSPPNCAAADSAAGGSAAAGSAAAGSAVDCGVSKGTRLRTTTQWQALQQAISAQGGWRVEKGSHFVTYAAGGVYGMSALAAKRMVNTSCLTRVGSLPCQGCSYNVGGVPAHTHEDAAVGLCMHLCAAKLIQCHAFAVHSPPGAEGWKLPAALASSLREASSNHTQPHGHTHSHTHSHTRSGAPSKSESRDELLAHVRRTFNDHVPAGRERPGQHYLAKHPIALHPVKQLGYYLPLWRSLEIRDAHNQQELDAWRREAGVVPGARARAALEWLA